LAQKLAGWAIACPATLFSGGFSAIEKDKAMAIVRMLTSIAGADFSRNKGDQHECSDAEAERLIAAGFAEAIESPAPTAKAKAERAVATVKRETRGVISSAQQAARQWLTLTN
jgi:hypothetical protein